MGHLTRIKEEYRALAERLGRGAVSFVEPAAERAREGYRELIEVLYSAEEAELAARMPLRPQPLSVLCERLKRSAAELEPKLHALCEKGLVIDVVQPATGITLYVLAPPSVGFVEFASMRTHASIDHERFLRAVNKYLYGDKTFLAEAFDGAVPLSRALAYEDTLDPLPDVLDYERTTHLIDSARALAVSLCSCRHQAAHEHQACAAPTDNCLSLNEGAEYVIRHGLGRSIDKVEAQAIIDNSREHNLVQTADNVAGRPAFICNCCACCCMQLRSANQYGLVGVNPSGFCAEANPERCRGCSRCSRVCPVGAITMHAVRQPRQSKNALVARLDPERCLGCGVCLRACKHEALTMAHRARKPLLPQNAVEKAARVALDHGRLADFLIDHGNGVGFRFLRDALNALLRLPPAKRLLASQQLGSLFFRVLIARVPDPFA